MVQLKVFPQNCAPHFYEHFNSSMVQLKVNLLILHLQRCYHFNSSMVQLKVMCLKTLILFLLFQFQYGAAESF